MSLPSLLLDDLIVSLLKAPKNATILDFGAGSGTLARRMDKKGYKVLAYEPVKIMRDLCQKLTPKAIYPNIEIVDHLEPLTIGNVDSVICINVLNHVDSLGETLEKLYGLLRRGGQLIIAIPHPLKDMGRWQKEQVDGKWQYLEYLCGDYMNEGKVSRTREDVDGNVVVKKAVMNHYKISTYFSELSRAGFQVRQLLEPAPDKMVQRKFPILYTKSSRIPYFLILECYK